MNLYQKIIEVRKVANGFKKDAKSFNYDYVSGNQILGKMKDKMNELGLILIPSIKSSGSQQYDYLDKYGKEKTDFITNGEMMYTWLDAEKPEDKLEIQWAFYGQQDDISKSFGSALTYAERYFLLKFFGLPTDCDDPDSRDTTGRKSIKKSNTPYYAKKASGDNITIISAEELHNIQLAAQRREIDWDGFCKYFKIKKLPDLPSTKYSEALKLIGQKPIKGEAL